MFAALQNSTVMTGGAVARYYTSESPPFRTAQESGIKWGLGTDAKIVSPYPAFLTLYFAVTGKDVAGNVVLRNETVTREQALIAHTRSNAWFLFMEDHLGSLEPGKYADLVVRQRLHDGTRRRDQGDRVSPDHRRRTDGLRGKTVILM